MKAIKLVNDFENNFIDEDSEFNYDSETDLNFYTCYDK